ncbi:hypothetical protein BCR35DRAFT_158520 [Leucosporidium creatinivorum]|uniref:Uncharacterized protein n=1 Tax=Leucosporidium creatinivorum TaxID=106004 RepID=A0A1Y2G404_9BASI|nr:hypothetical protein BCR35DRAFT_158520 [Leucosporidium creatinivorum]
MPCSPSSRRARDENFGGERGARGRSSSSVWRSCSSGLLVSTQGRRTRSSTEGPTEQAMEANDRRSLAASEGAVEEACGSCACGLLMLREGSEERRDVELERRAWKEGAGTRLRRRARSSDGALRRLRFEPSQRTLSCFPSAEVPSSWPTTTERPRSRGAGGLVLLCSFVEAAE